MVFRYYTNVLSQASRALASGILVVGMLLIGFGVLIAALPEVFAYLVAALFIVVGVGCGLTALKIFWAQHRMDKAEGPGPMRHNVRVRQTEFFDDTL
ncbi:MAG: hypothetical protein JW993_01555 [Sedimentisphaerales bacterium]|nr:hypothetical protein [Sedimentisphaerales bacterium]